MNNKTTFHILIILGIAHCINDTLQSLITATYPLLKEEMGLNFAQIGIITLCYQLFASILQPIFGGIFDKRNNSISLIIGMCITSVGVIFLSFTQSYLFILLSVMLFGVGSSIFHPESSRIAHIAAGEKRGVAQSIFQVGGNLGGALGPLLIALILCGNRYNLLYCLILSCMAISFMLYLRKWIIGISKKETVNKIKSIEKNPLGKRQTSIVLAILLLLIFSKYVYMETIRSYYTFYLIDTFGISIRASQIALFVFLFATAIGTLIGGIIGDKIGRRKVILYSILGSAPFSLLLPYSNLTFSYVITFLTGLILSSAFPAIIVYAQELIPKKIGLISGLFFGFAFGIAGIASAVLGYLIDVYSLEDIYKATSFMPLLGAIAFFLPELKDKKNKMLG